MIQNSKQYSITRAKIAQLESVHEIAKQSKGKMHPVMYEGMIAGLKSQIEDMRREMREYDSCKKTHMLAINGIEQMAVLLTQARIARGYTQKDLAEKLRLKPQQIQRYEATQYRSASLKRIQEIMRTLQVDIVADIPLRTMKTAGSAAAIQRVSSRTA